MSRFHSYINSAIEILKTYKGEEPFAGFLKKYFGEHKKFGSRDRKQVSQLCYCFFRLGRLNNGPLMDERLLQGLFLCLDEPNEILGELKPEWNDKMGLSLEEKCSILDIQFSIFKLFPWKDELSDKIDHEKLAASFLVQPDVFLRLRPGHEAHVREKLSKADMAFKTVSEDCLALPAGSKIEQAVALNYEAVIQDLNSQRTAEFFKPAIYSSPMPLISAWDCCAGSGGKSIMLYDLHKQLDLTVSDVRESIISNLKRRFQEAEINNYHSIVADVAASSLKLPARSKFDLVICDAPCTGSGTWSRTPEQAYYFEVNKIEEYASRQKRIVANTIPHLGPGSHFIYITCSVFKKENEEVADFIRQKFQLELIRAEVLKGYNKKADTMFAALFRKDGK